MQSDIKMLVFIKKVFYIESFFLSSLVSATSLSCTSMKNQECEVKPEIINVNSNKPVFYPFTIKKVNVAAVVIILMIHMQRYVFLMS